MVVRFQSNSSQNRENQISWYLTVQSRIEILIAFEFRGISRYKFELRFLFNLNLQLTKISPPFRISICISFTNSSLIFQGTGCMQLSVSLRQMNEQIFVLRFRQICLRTNSYADPNRHYNTDLNRHMHPSVHTRLGLVQFISFQNPHYYFCRCQP